MPIVSIWIRRHNGHIRRAREDNWQQSSFDLAQGLDIKVMKSKHSVETLDRLFGRC